MKSAVMTSRDWQRYEALVPSLRQVGHRCRGAVPESQPHAVAPWCRSLNCLLTLAGKVCPGSILQAKEVTCGSIAKLGLQTVRWQDASGLVLYAASSMSSCGASALS